MSNFKAVIEQIKLFDYKDLKDISEEILQLLKLTEDSSRPTSSTVNFCRRCEDVNIVKFGKDKNGKQRYKCRNCGATFTDTSYSILSNTHQNIGVWKKIH